MEEFTKTLRLCSDFPDGAWYLAEGPGCDETPQTSDPSGEILLVSDPDEGQYLVVQRFYPRAEIDNPDDSIVHADDLLEFDGHNNVLISYGPVTDPQQCRHLVSGLVRFHNNLMLRRARR